MYWTQLMIVFGFLMSFDARACYNFIATSEIPNAINHIPTANKCGPSDPCVCFDGIDFDVVTWDGKSFTVNQTKVDAKNARLDKITSRKEVMLELKQGIPAKSFDELSTCEKKTLVGVECTDQELGI